MDKKEIRLEERTKKLAKPYQIYREDHISSFIVFGLNEKYYALQNEFILSISKEKNVRILDKLDNIFIGIVNFKGYIYGIADPEKRTHKDNRSNEMNLILLKNQYVGICFDSIYDIVKVEEKDIMKISESDIPYIKRFFRHENNDIMIIEPKEFGGDV